MARKTTLDELGEMLAHVVHNMATKDDIADLRRDVVADITRLDTKIEPPRCCEWVRPVLLA